ncbi:DMT family transporter [Azorhizobium caulinodans]|uniref:Putative transmembrane protein n=1 Tax=Azorhizobium caulinodans (strain ATCC 43989 / DSM 5975 / JCM 20966 / LMG 6465 / NBRC 14845 / NCIMB 13405 / ORS 571) TaxID=438753 RepID=A8HSY6_AZOC5|nr:DMT family transporter [Azorhizobium caulinodans]BAF90231.1 putative transmembrane protein [Azorhizobium caulinodans ORS 571]
MSSRVTLGFLLGFIGVVIFGATVPATRLALNGLDPFFITFGRAALAGLMAGALLLVRRRVPWLGRKGAFRDLLLVVASLMFGFPLLMAFGMQTVPASHAGVVLGLLPIATTFGAMVFSGERPSPLFLAFSLLGAGLVVVFAARNGGMDRFGAGDLLLLGSVVACGIGYPVSARLARFMQGWEVIAWALVIALPITLPAALLFLPREFAAVPTPAWLGFLYVAAMSQFIGFFFWNAGLAMGGVARVAQVQLLQTFVTIALAWPINGEPLDLETVMFAVAVVAVVVLGRKAKVGGAPAPAE